MAEADLVRVTGDHAAGARPGQVLDRLTALGDRLLLLRGDADRALVALARGEAPEPPDEGSAWAAQQSVGVRTRSGSRRARGDAHAPTLTPRRW